MPGTKLKIVKSTKMSFKYAGISARLSVMSVVILSIVFGSYAYLTCQDSISEINTQYKDRALSFVSMFDAMINTEDDFKDIGHIQRYFDSLTKTDKKVQKISLYAKQDDNRVIRTASSAHDQIGDPADDFDAEPIRTGNIVWEEKGQVVEILAPIHVGEIRVASLGVYMDLTPRSEAVFQYIKRAIFYAVIALLLLAMLLYFVIRKEIFNPLWSLTEGVKEVAVGNLEKRVNLSRSDEFGELSREFDDMAEALKQREDENKQLLGSIKEKWIEAEEKSHTDYLTKLENHRSFQERLDIQINIAAQSQSNLTAIFLDIDNFKGFNDINGHMLGDKALFDVADIIKESIRECDKSARYGGEEFAILMPDTNRDEAYAIAELIRVRIEDHLFSTKYGLGYLTVSLGIATYPLDAACKEDLLTAADSAMYASKYAGRNKTTLCSSLNHSNKKAS